MTSFKRLGIYGVGNVGSALLMALGDLDISADEIVVTARNLKKADAAILDLASAYPDLAAKAVGSLELKGDFDLVVVTAGILPHEGITAEELLSGNIAIAVEALKDATTKKIVVIGTPVDILTEELAKLPQFTGIQIIGFGGELDRARVAYSLLKHNIRSERTVYAIGEHGPRTIPVYSEEQDYEAITSEATTVLKRIISSGVARNLATGTQLARLVQALSGAVGDQIMCLSIPNAEHDNLSITWPYTVNGQGVTKAVDIGEQEPKSAKLFEELLESRRTR
jgi:malate/lactate dehydrogenase